MTWTAVDVGKYRGKGKTLPQIVFDDPDWFFWAIGQRVFRGTLADEAERIDGRARRIRVPPSDGRPRVAEYTRRSRDGAFTVLELVETSRPPHSRSERRPWIDLSYATGSYDKTGCRLLVSAAKFALFGSATYRLTRRRAEAFFDDDDNFASDTCGISTGARPPCPRPGN